jgi:hypothetical protein
VVATVSAVIGILWVKEMRDNPIEA